MLNAVEWLLSSEFNRIRIQYTRAYTQLNGKLTGSGGWSEWRFTITWDDFGSDKIQFQQAPIMFNFENYSKWLSMSDDLCMYIEVSRRLTKKRTYGPTTHPRASTTLPYSTSTRLASPLSNHRIFYLRYRQTAHPNRWTCL